MLRNIPKVLPPDLVRDMMMMGHSDFLILADANFPGAAHAKRFIRMDGIMIPQLLEAVLQLFPLDTFVPDPVRLMRNLPTEPVPEIWQVYRADRPAALLPGGGERLRDRADRRRVALRQHHITEGLLLSLSARAGRAADP